MVPPILSQGAPRPPAEAANEKSPTLVKASGTEITRVTNEPACTTLYLSSFRV